jgi:hypothetical protein
LAEQPIPSITTGVDDIASGLEYAVRQAIVSGIFARPKSRAVSKELWWTPPRIIAFSMAAGIILVLSGMAVGAFLVKMLR